jgi:hypothetical protein
MLREKEDIREEETWGAKAVSPRVIEGTLAATVKNSTFGSWLIINLN